MKLFLEAVGESEITRLLRKLHQVAGEKLHDLIDDPADADMIVFCGSWSMDGLVSSITSHSLLRLYPAKCVACNDDDIYLPLLPGVYCSPRSGISVRMGRVRSYSYIARHGDKGNPFVASLPAERHKDLLFSFQGATTSFVRKRLFRMDFDRKDVLIEDTTFHQNWSTAASKAERQRIYVDTIARSDFALCPRGSGTGSFRLFEVMRMGATPVLISDDYVLPEGPDWDSFLIRVPEKDIARLPSFLEPYRPRSAAMGQLAKYAWVRWFSTEQEFNQIVAGCDRALKSARMERVYRGVWPVLIGRQFAFRWVRRRSRALALWIFHKLHLRFPYSVRDETTVPPFDPNIERDDIRS